MRDIVGCNRKCSKRQSHTHDDNFQGPTAAARHEQPAEEAEIAAPALQCSKPLRCVARRTSVVGAVVEHYRQGFVRI